jgi:hypothetical protein
MVEPLAISETDTEADLATAPPLTPKELAFCEAFANPESATFGHARKSAESAGYVEPHNAGWKLRRRPSIRAKLAEYHAAVTVAVGKVLTDLENERLAAMEKGDIQAAVRATELMGKHLSMWTERVQLDVPLLRHYSDEELTEGRRLAAFMAATYVAGDALALTGPATPAQAPVDQKGS